MNLKNRFAKCSQCKRLEPSNPNLVFFEYRGIDSEYGNTMCKHCGFAKAAHKDLDCKNFEAIIQDKYDRFYCGCQGWD